MNPISTTAPVQALVTVTDNGSSITPDSVAWAVENASVATVDPVSGLVTPVAPGTTVVNATCTVTTPSGVQTVVGTGVITVTAVGDNLVATVDFQPAPPK